METQVKEATTFFGKLPSHTLKYFAQQSYETWLYRGINAVNRRKTVQGVEILITCHPALKNEIFPRGYVLIQEVVSGEEYKVKIQAGWGY